MLDVDMYKNRSHVNNTHTGYDRHDINIALTFLLMQSRFGDKPLGIRRVCPQIGTAVLKGLEEKKRRTDCITGTGGLEPTRYRKASSQQAVSTSTKSQQYFKRDSYEPNRNYIKQNNKQAATTKQSLIPQPPAVAM